MKSTFAMMRTLCAVLLMCVVVPAYSEEIGSLHQTVAGVEIYLGVVPAAMVRDHPRQHLEGRMHGGTTGRGYHVMVALFETKTGARIVNAQVGARLVSSGQSAPETKLEPMTIAGAQTYGNYFDMVPGGSYRIDFSIQRPGVATPVQATFHWLAR